MSELLNVAQIATILKVSPDTVVRHFARMPGVTNMGTEGSLKRRRYRVLRIPKHVIEKFVGHPVTLPTVTPKSRRRKKDWMRQAAFSLAKVLIENAEDPTERKIFERIAFDARVLTFVPEAEWDDVALTGPARWDEVLGGFCEEE
jgi:hypothetical protein